mmetsp:Transcript_28329/g.27268  ORF Transcript_28329/g.27268 Transcript_28329/m.27268 type:complete len:317 (-) Transcript_28329:624-1574(-)
MEVLLQQIELFIKDVLEEKHNNFIGRAPIVPDEVEVRVELFSFLSIFLFLLRFFNDVLATVLREVCSHEFNHVRVFYRDRQVLIERAGLLHILHAVLGAWRSLINLVAIFLLVDARLLLVDGSARSLGSPSSPLLVPIVSILLLFHTLLLFLGILGHFLLSQLCHLLGAFINLLEGLLPPIISVVLHVLDQHLHSVRNFLVLRAHQVIKAPIDVIERLHSSLCFLLLLHILLLQLCYLSRTLPSLLLLLHRVFGGPLLLRKLVDLCIYGVPNLVHQNLSALNSVIINKFKLVFVFHCEEEVKDGDQNWLRNELPPV